MDSRDRTARKDTMKFALTPTGRIKATVASGRPIGEWYLTTPFAVGGAVTACCRIALLVADNMILDALKRATHNG